MAFLCPADLKPEVLRKEEEAAALMLWHRRAGCTGVRDDPLVREVRVTGWSESTPRESSYCKRATEYFCT